MVESTKSIYEQYTLLRANGRYWEATGLMIELWLELRETRLN